MRAPVPDSNRRHRWIAKVVFDLLVEECGAREHLRGDFIHFLSQTDGAEFRFQGSLGFGGKLYNEAKGFRVSCYTEDQTPERDAAIKLTNELLWRFGIALFDDARRPCPHCLGCWTGPLIDCEVCPRCFVEIDADFLPGLFE